MAGRLRLSLLGCALLCSISSIASAQERYALGVFHFNLQYVAGGMVGFSPTPSETDVDSEGVEDLIITESFTPVLELYDKHPSWGVDIELQGYFLDVLAARHPDVLDLLRKLAKRGQIDVVSFHYSDQFFIAYPEEDWRRSQALTAATFEKHDIPLSRTVFCQEGQSGMALAERMAEAGYRNMVWPKNLWTYQHGEFDAAPLYEFGDVRLVVGGKGASYAKGSVDVGVTWTYMDDGELMATGDANPYLLDIFHEKPEKVAEYEAELQSLVDQGYQLVTVDEYVDAVQNRVPLAPMPPLMDGTWQPNSTTAVFKWMGGKSLWPGEHDNEVRTLGSLAHRELVAAETAAKVANLDARETLDSAWRLLALGQVTDATGINPFRGEVEYGIAHLTEALRIARQVIRDAKAGAGGGPFVVDPAAGTFTPGKADELRGEREEPQLALEIVAGDRDVEESWELVGVGLHRVELTIRPGEATLAGVTFPGELTDEWVTTRALDDGELATYLRTDFTFEEFYLALPTGLVSLGPSRFLLKDLGYVHLAAKITRDSGDIAFQDDTLVEGEGATWVFYVYDGDATSALELAQRVNVDRELSR
jgi:hypothetical protein